MQKRTSKKKNEIKAEAISFYMGRKKGVTALGSVKLKSNEVFNYAYTDME